MPRGVGTAAIEHVPGERFILMDRSRLAFVEAELFELGRALTFRVTSYGLTQGSTMTVKRADERAGELAAEADQSRGRGVTCERAYDGLGK